MKKIYAAVILFFCINIVSAQITFQKTFGGSNPDYSFAVEQTFDGGYIIGGMTKSFGYGDFDMYLIKTNSAGDTLWTRSYGKATDDRIKSVHQTTDSGYIFTGFINYDTYLVKTNSQGTIEWIRNFGYGSGGGSGGNCIHQTADSGYIVTGSSTQIGAGNYDVYLVKTNSLGDTLWTKSYGDTGGEQATSVMQTSDHGYLISGSSWTFIGCTGSCPYDAYMIKTDSIGDTLWTRYYGYSGINKNDSGFDAIETNDGGYALLGSSDSLHTFLLKTDAAGYPLWCKSYTGYIQNVPVNPTYSVNQTADGGYFITSQISVSNYNISLIKTDSSGNVQWSKLLYGGTGIGMYGHPAADGGYIVASTINGIGAGGYDIILIKTDSLGNSGCNDTTITISENNVVMPLANHITIVSSPGIVNTPPEYYIGSGSIINTLCTTVSVFNIQHQNQISISPNPFTDEITVSIGQLAYKAEIKIYDVYGRIVYEQTFPIRSADGLEKLNLAHLKQGIYFVEVMTEEGMVVRKIVKQ